MRAFFRKLKSFSRRAVKEAELRDELQFHLDEEAEEQRRDGLIGAQAHNRARRDLGNIALIREDTRAAWTWNFWEELCQDSRYALRAMAANKTFSSLAILSLALGIGAKTPIPILSDPSPSESQRGWRDSRR